MRHKDWLTLAVLALLWGSSFLFVKIALVAVPPLSLVLSRVVIGAVALWLICAALGISGLRDFLRHLPRFLLLGGVGSVIPFALLFWAQTHIGAGLAAILNATTPVFTALLAVLVFRSEQPRLAVFGGILLGLAGVTAMVGISELTGMGEHPLAQLAVIGAALSYGLTGNIAKRYRDLPGLTMAAGQNGGAALLMAPFALWIDRPWTLAMPEPGILLAVAALGLLSTGLAYAIFYNLIKTTGATAASLVTILIPAVATVEGAVLLGEALGLQHALGMALILAGLLVMDSNLRGLIFRKQRRN